MLSRSRIVSMLSIESRANLRVDGELIPLVEQLVSCIGFGDSIGAIERGKLELRQSPGWIVFYGSEQHGIAINLEGVVPSRSHLRLRLNSMQHAQQVVAGCGGRDDFPLWLTDREDCPVDWTLYRVSVLNGLILCAVSDPAPVLPAHLLATASGRDIRIGRLTRVNLVLVGYLCWSGIVSVGESCVMYSLPVACAQQRWRGEITVTEGGLMKIQSEDPFKSDLADGEIDTNSPRAIVRLDIGEVELSLQEVLALRKGTAISLHVEMPLRCFMRVGATTLAQGELSLEDQGLVLRITQVMHS